MPVEYGLSAHEMVSIDHYLIVIGGSDGIDGSGSIYVLSCSNHVCKWDKLQTELKVPRWSFTAIALPDDFIDCT